MKQVPRFKLKQGVRSDNLPGALVQPASVGMRSARSRPMVSANQLPMFMSARQIKQQYQPIEGDRRDAYDYREGEFTGRSHTTGGNANPKIGSVDRRNWAVMAETGDTHYRSGDRMETDEQVWARKLDESQMDPDEYKDAHSPIKGPGYQDSQATPSYETLMDRSSAPPAGWQLKTETGKPSPGTDTRDMADYEQEAYVRDKQDDFRFARNNDSLYDKLRSDMAPGGPGFTGHVHLGSQFGGSNKQMVAGAHHRIAAMDEIDPDRLLPVVHSRTTADAKKGYAGLPYT